jgi:hypothetical protein
VYAEFVYDSDADEIYAIAVFPGDASERDAGPDPHVLHREELPEDDRSAVDTSIDQDTYAELGDGRDYVETAYDGTYVRTETDVYRTRVETVA